MTSVLWVRHHMRMVAGLPWWMRAYEIARLLRIRARITRQHRVTDPACLWFAGHGVMRRMLGVRVPSIRRLRFDRARGHSCPVCTRPKPRPVLVDDQRYRELRDAAAREFEHTPELYLARNRLAVYVELLDPGRIIHRSPHAR